MDFLKKSVKIFGRTIPVAILAVLISAGLGSAALVTYLSNQTKAQVNVESPFEIKIADGAQNSNSVSSVSGIETWNEDDSITWNIFGGETVTFTGYIKNKANVDIAVKDKEVIRHIELDDMVGLDTEFTFFGARYWRPQASPGRVSDYAEDVNNGWDPIWDEGMEMCRENTGSSDCVAEGYCRIKDGICYFTDAAFSYIQTEGQLVSDYPYTYPAGLEEIMQVVATFDPAITPGSYEYSRQIIPESD